MSCLHGRSIPLHARLNPSLTAFCRQTDHFTLKDLSRIFTLFTKAKKRLEIQLKKHSELIKPVHQSKSALVSKCISATIATFFRGNIQKLRGKMPPLNLSVSHPVALQQYLSYMNATLTLNRRFFCWHRHSSCSCTLKGQ